MLNKYFLFFIFLAVVSGNDNDWNKNDEPGIDMLIPNLQRNKMKLKNTLDNNDLPCSRRSLKDGQRLGTNSINTPNLQDQKGENFEQPDFLQQVHNLAAKQHNKDEGHPLQNKELDHSAPDKPLEEIQSLDLRSALSKQDSANSLPSGQFEPTNLAAELQDCLEKKLHQKKPNVIVIIPVLDDKEKSKDKDSKDEKYLLTFIEPQERSHQGISSEISLQPVKDKGDCNKTESKVEKFLRTGIAVDHIELNNQENLDGRRRNTYYERLPFTEVVESNKAGEPSVMTAADELNSTTDISVADLSSRSGRPTMRVCYACSTLNNPSCSSPNRMTTVKYCVGTRNACVKKTYETGSGQTVLVRDCASKCNENSFPSGIVPKYKTCNICYTDLCNGAFTVQHQSFLIFILVSPVFLCKMFV